MICVHSGRPTRHFITPHPLVRTHILHVPFGHLTTGDLYIILCPEVAYTDAEQLNYSQTIIVQ